MKLEWNNKWNNFIGLKKSGKKYIYGYRTKKGTIIISSELTNSSAIVEQGEYVTGDKNLEKEVYNIMALFKKFPFINFILLEKENQAVKIDKKETEKINEKIKNYIMNNINKQSGKIKLPEIKTVLYYSNELKKIKLL